MPSPLTVLRPPAVVRTCVILAILLSSCASSGESPDDASATPSAASAQGGDRLDAIFAAYEERSANDPRFAEYRIEALDGADPWPDGWLPSDAVRRMVEQGGWWPGEWSLASGQANMSGLEQFLDVEWAGEPEGDVMWIELGSIWEQDFYYTPLTRTPHRTAPVAVVEAQSLQVAVVFPDEAALLEAFLDATDVESEDAELLAEWVINGPSADDAVEAQAQQQVRERIASIGSTHPLWADGMPLYVDPQLDEDLVALLLGRTDR